MVEKTQFKFQNTTATKKIFQLKKRIRAVRGGTGASKTISIIVWSINYAQSYENELISVVSESFPHLSGGAMLDFENIMKDRGYWQDKAWIKTPKPTYTFPNGSKIEFLSVDSYGKAHGPRRDVLFLNEGNNIPWLIADQLITRTRKIVWIDWNPTNEFWFDTELRPNRKDIDFITLTFKDNEALDEGSLNEIYSHKNNSNWWKVYALGELGTIEGRIYKDWAIVDEIPHRARFERYGLDFGYTNDPSALVGIYYYDGGYILDEVAYQKGLSNKGIADIIKAQSNPQGLVIADSAEPKSIDDIKSYGVNIVPAVKGKDSVVNGIQLIQDQRMSITKRSINIIKEYRNYLWETDRDGKVLNEPEHEFSHTMDAVRYPMVSILKKPTVKIEASQPAQQYYPEIGL